MPLISTTIPSLIDGISQQPPQNRLKTQGETQVNFTSSVVEGLVKRAPLKHRAELLSSTLGAAYVHSINRDGTEQYIVTILDGSIKVFDLDGVEKTVNTPDGVGYLSVTDALTDYAATTIGDYTFIVNKTKTVTMDDDDRSDPAKFEAMVVCDFWSRPQNSTEFYANNVLVMDGSCGDGSPPSNASGGVLAGDLASSVSEPAIIVSTVDTVADLPGTVINGDFHKVLNKKTEYRWKEIFPETPAATWESEANLGYSNSEADLPDPGDTFAAETPAASGVYKWEVGYGRFFDIEEKAVLYPYAFYEGVGGEWVRSGEVGDARGSVAYYADDVEFNLVQDERTSVNGSFPDSEVWVVQGSTESIQDLPITAPRGFKVEITGADGSESYWVEHQQPWADAEYFAGGSWVETIGPSVRKRFTNSTMPHVLVRESDGTFTFRQADWSPRRVGDENSNAVPSFVGNEINDVFLFKNRLGFLSETSVSMSQAGSFFNFFRTTVTDLLDEERIDVSASSRKVTPLNHAIPFEEGLLVLSSETQLMLKGGELLTPRTVSFEIVSEYQGATLAAPVGSGERVFWAANSGSYSAIREFIIDPETLQETGVDVTKHVPKYVPKNVKQLATDSSNGILACLSGDDPDALYVYRYYLQNSKKVQSAWFQWTFEGATIIGITHIDDRLYLVNQYTDGLFLESVDTGDGSEDTGQDWVAHLDRRVDETDCVVAYAAGPDETTFTLPYDLVAGATYKVVTRVGSTTEGVTPVVNSTGTATVVVAGDYSAEPVFIGQTFEAKYRFTQPYPKQSNRDGSESPIGEGRLQVRQWSLWYEDTGAFTASVYYDHTDTASYEFSGNIAGSLNTTIGDVPLETGRFKFPVLAENRQSAVEITTTSHLPAKFTSAEWEGYYHSRSTRSSRI